MKAEDMVVTDLDGNVLEGSLPPPRIYRRTSSCIAIILEEVATMAWHTLLQYSHLVRNRLTLMRLKKCIVEKECV